MGLTNVITLVLLLIDLTQLLNVLIYIRNTDIGSVHTSCKFRRTEDLIRSKKVN